MCIATGTLGTSPAVSCLIGRCTIWVCASHDMCLIDACTNWVCRSHDMCLIDACMTWVCASHDMCLMEACMTWVGALMDMCLIDACMTWVGVFHDTCLKSCHGRASCFVSCLVWCCHNCNIKLHMIHFIYIYIYIYILPSWLIHNATLSCQVCQTVPFGNMQECKPTEHLTTINCSINPPRCKAGQRA